MVIKRTDKFRISRKVNPKFGENEFEPREWFYLEYRTIHYTEGMIKYDWECLKVCFTMEKCERIFNMLTK